MPTSCSARQDTPRNFNQLSRDPYGAGRGRGQDFRAEITLLGVGGVMVANAGGGTSSITPARFTDSPRAATRHAARIKHG